MTGWKYRIEANPMFFDCLPVTLDVKPSFLKRPASLVFGK